MNKSTDVHWYPLRVTYSRELALKDLLDAEHIENFIPMHYEFVLRSGQRIRKLVPVVHNLVFVRTSFERVDRVKKAAEGSLTVRYIFDRETRRPLVVPEVQMQSFIAVSGSYEEQIVYLDPCLTAMQKGDCVRITGGVFAGVEGMVLRVKGDRRVAVCIQGVMAVATAYIHPSLVEKIKD